MANQNQRKAQNTGSSNMQGRRRETSQEDEGMDASRTPRRARGEEQQGQQEGGERQDLLGAITPAFNEARTYIEGSPVRAAVIGAVAGSVIMTLFATERGRAFLSQGYSLANPWISKYAREFISRAAGDATEKALLQ